MLMQLLDYTLNVHYQSGERMHLSDALSCLSSHNMAAGKTYSISVEKLHQHTANDPDLKLLIDHINNGFPDTSAKCPKCIQPNFSFRDGFPDTSAKCPKCIQPNFSFRDELNTCHRLVLKGNNRVVMPASLR